MMRTLAIDPIMLVVAVLFAWLFVRMLRRGAVTVSRGTAVVSRAANPALYWAVIAANALIVIAAFLTGIGILRR